MRRVIIQPPATRRRPEDRAAASRLADAMLRSDARRRKAAAAKVASNGVGKRVPQASPAAAGAAPAQGPRHLHLEDLRLHLLAKEKIKQ
jgi:hypothetical protein